MTELVHSVTVCLEEATVSRHFKFTFEISTQMKERNIVWG